jgi:hypothetical protein
MEQQFRVVKQIIDLQRVSCEGMINGLITMWEQAGAVFEGIPWFPEEGRKAFRQWVDINKKACDNLKSAMDSGYSNLEKMFGTSAQQREQMAP